MICLAAVVVALGEHVRNRFQIRTKHVQICGGRGRRDKRLQFRRHPLREQQQRKSSIFCMDYISNANIMNL
jgi:hypothetical protein